jgi:flavin-dependent dehydrogenase
MQGFRLLTDYAGHVFGNIYLVGDAAGLVGDWDGGGIYAAWASGVETARHILSHNQGFPLLEAVLAAKRYQRRIVRGLTFNRTVSRALFALLPAAFRFIPLSQRFYRAIHPPLRESE